MSGKYPTLKFAIFAVICATVAIWIVSMIGNLQLFQGLDSYEAVFDDATGLLENDEVRIAGVPVGRVESVVLERGQAVVRFSIREDITLPEETTLGVRWRGVIGLRYLYLYPQGDGAIEPGYRFATERTFSPASIALAIERITPVVRALDPEVQNVFLEAMQEALVGQEEDVRNLIREAASLTQTLATRENEIARILQNAESLTQTLATADDDVRRWLGNFAEAAETVADRNDMLEAFLTDVANAQGELEHNLDTNHENIRGALAALDDILAVVSEQYEDLDSVFRYVSEGMMPYHLMSRWGNFFLLNFVVTTLGEEGEQSDGRGGEMKPREQYADTRGFQGQWDETTDVRDGAEESRGDIPPPSGGERRLSLGTFFQPGPGGWR
jgi:phospholipid/cholesterol/gamma-HCH transport system substrate-binding protein